MAVLFLFLITLKIQNRIGGLKWINLAQDLKKRQALVNIVMNIQVAYSVGTF